MSLADTTAGIKKMLEEKDRRRLDMVDAVSNGSPRPSVLYHATTPKKAARYRESGRIISPVRGFTTLQAAMAWAMKVGRTVVYEIPTPSEFVHKLPDHHNEFGEAWWIDQDVTDYRCRFSAEGRA